MKTRAKEEMLEKATKLEPDSPEAMAMEMFYSGDYDEDYGYFESLYEFMRYWTENNNPEMVKRPKYVWGTHKRVIELDATDIIDNACARLHEDATEDLDYEELQKLLDSWLAKNADKTATYFQDTRVAIRVPWREEERP